MNEPNFDFNTSCVTLVTCLFNIKNWLLSTPNTMPIVIYLEPTNYTYTTNNATFAAALAATNQTDAPTTSPPPLTLPRPPDSLPRFIPPVDLLSHLSQSFLPQEVSTVNDSLCGISMLATGEEKQLLPALLDNASL